MSLVERTVEKLDEARPMIKATRRVQRGPGVDLENVESKLFTLDEELLNRQGFYTPDTKYSKLSSEFHTIKRRLLRRLSFYKLENEKQQNQKVKKRQANTILMTSTRPAEGKTFTAINLALSLAIEDGISVLLIDADIPRPKILTHFGLGSGKGLTDLILDPGLNASDLFLRADGYPLSILSEGQQVLDHEEIFTKKEMSSLVYELSARYPDRLIIFDAPPVLAGHDAVILSKHVDEVVFVVEANGTPQTAVISAIDELLDSTDSVSLVLNKCSVPEISQQYGSYKEYYNKEYKKKYSKAAGNP